MRQIVFRSVVGLALLLSSPLAHAQQQSFSDVSPNHPVFEAVEFLKAQGIISGYADGTYQPGKKVNRAEAVKILVAPLVNQQQLLAFNATVYQDIPGNAWYLAFVEAARQSFGFIDGPPAKILFYGERPVQKAEFLKMLLKANKVDTNAFSEIRLALSSDVVNPDEWYYPHMRYALSSSMTMISADGLLSPGRELTRGDVALFLYRFMMYKAGRRTQALLSEAETEIQNVLNSLDKNDIAQAEYASARALIAARGAHASRPQEPIVQAAVKTTESFRALVRAYRAGVTGDLDTVIRLSGEAWNLAARAQELDPSLANISSQVQLAAQKMADSARELKEKQTP